MGNQIEEMAVENLVAFLWHNTAMYDEDLIFDVAEAIVNEGYRKQEWISVEERLPEKNYHDFVLAWNGLHVEFLHYSHRYKQWEDYYSLKEHPWKVTHWMPLPEPPKGE